MFLKYCFEGVEQVKHIVEIPPEMLYESSVQYHDIIELLLADQVCSFRDFNLRFFNPDHQAYQLLRKDGSLKIEEETEVVVY
jgi:hypothetical protein